MASEQVLWSHLRVLMSRQSVPVASQSGRTGSNAASGIPDRHARDSTARSGEHGLDELLGVEGFDVLVGLAQPDELDREVDLVADGDDDPALGRAVELGQEDSGHVDGGFVGWKNGTAEGHTEITEAARHMGKAGLRWTVVVDHEHDGGEGGNYPVGWPRLGRDFKPGELDMSQYDTLEFWMRIDSNRDEVADDRTPVGLVISSHGRKKALYEKTLSLPRSLTNPFRFPHLLEAPSWLVE